MPPESVVYDRQIISPLAGALRDKNVGVKVTAERALVHILRVHADDSRLKVCTCMGAILL